MPTFDEFNGQIDDSSTEDETESCSSGSPDIPDIQIPSRAGATRADYEAVSDTV